MTAEMTTALTNAFTSIQGDIMTGLAIVAPLGLVIMGAYLTWRYGVRFFKVLSK